MEDRRLGRNGLCRRKQQHLKSVAKVTSIGRIVTCVDVCVESAFVEQRYNVGKLLQQFR